MINKLKTKFIIYAMLSIFILLLLILGSINVVNFTLLSNDADKITQMIADNKGTFDTRPKEFSPPNEGGNNNPNQEPPDFSSRPMPNQMGPSSPETAFSIRYVTVSIDKSGQSNIVSYNISALTQEESIKIANDVVNKKTTGWVNNMYRYRVYKLNGNTFVTIIDQGREMLPSIRVLAASIIGSCIGLIVSLIVLIFVSNNLVKPLIDADRKQKRFISDATREIKEPVTTIDTDNAIIVQKYGESEETKSISRQSQKLNSLAKNLSSVSILYENNTTVFKNINISTLANNIALSYQDLFEKRNIDYKYNVSEQIKLQSDEGLFRKLISELLDNSLKYALTYATFDISTTGERIVIMSSNDTSLPDGPLDMIFERFYRLSNSQNVDGSGLGLSIVKEITDLHKGRVYANCNNGIFTLKIEL